MTSIATGFLRGATDSGSRFLGSFGVKSVHYLVAGSFATSVPPFKSSATTLKFRGDDQLSGTASPSSLVMATRLKVNWIFRYTLRPRCVGQDFLRRHEVCAIYAHQSS